jgi:Arc/MetJ-type ribon-helix-helix transcriptional regulator
MSEWITQKIRRELNESIAAHIKEQKEYGFPKYDSIADFVQTAIVRLLKEEQGQRVIGRKKEREVVA